MAQSRDNIDEKKPSTIERRSAPNGDGNGRGRRKQWRPGVLDDRTLTMLLDAISSVSAAIVSATVGLPYIEARKAIAPDEEEKLRVGRAIQEVADKYEAFFTENKTVLEFGIAWAGVQAAHFDNFFTRTDSPAGQSPLQPSEALFLVIIILAPLLIFAVVSIAQHIKAYRDGSKNVYSPRSCYYA